MNAEKSEKRVKFDALPSPEVNSASISNIPRGKGFVQSVIEWLTPKNVFGEFKNKDTGWDNIKVNRSTVKNIVYHGGRDGKVALLESVPDLIKNGIFLETNPKNAQGLESHVFAAKANIDGVPYAVSFVVREDANGRRYYDHSLTKIMALDRVNDQAPVLTDGAKNGLRLTNPARTPSTGESNRNLSTYISSDNGNSNNVETLKPVNEQTATPAESTVNILKKHLGVNTEPEKNSDAKIEPKYTGSGSHDEYFTKQITNIT